MNFGLISYGLYMYHQSVNGTVHAFMWGQEPRIATWPQFFGSLFVMSFATAIATASYHLVEKPIRKAAHRVCSRLTTRKDSKSDRKLEKEFGSVLGNQASKPGLDREADGASLVGASKSQ